MKIQCFDAGGKNFQTIEATRMVVLDDHGNPIAFAAKYGPIEHIVATLQDPDFETLISTLGLRTPRIGKRIDIDSTD